MRDVEPDCRVLGLQSTPVNNYVHVKTDDLYRPNARFTPERQGYQVLTPFGKLGYSQKIGPKRYRIRIGRWRFIYTMDGRVVWLIYCGLRREDTYR